MQAPTAAPAGMASAPGALLFDLDGTLIDSMPLHQVAWRHFFAAHGLPFDEDGFFAATAGRHNDEILADLFPGRSRAELLTLADDKEALYRADAARSLRLIPGALAFLQQAATAGWQLAICTAAPLANIAVAFERFGLGALVHTTTSPADLKFGGAPGETLRGKPHPDIFEEAARRLGVPAARCVVFEDAPLGVEAARRAGMAAVALTTTLPASAFASYPNLRHSMADFTEFDLTTLARDHHHA